ncbi:MAG: purine-nucleoside phosphorylase [Kiritimatiellae bacterium]|nr:purine-nucleoside phosphorylase [Kiritimatiellia bacterium]MDD3543827.1 purine-nucleoside phosphorylase [Kiritimatiellia bacterium]MDD4622678.1 purine-nucleoside phosphorylase [Kiritimatiellia bacterium]
MNAEIFDSAAAVLPPQCFELPPTCGLILGSGWSETLECERTLVSLPYAAIPGLGASTVVGHTGEFRLFEQHGLRVAAFLGRRHWYEGAGWEPVVMPVELLRRMDTKNLLITNAAGGVNPALKPGDLMAISDHINTVGLNPLVGPVRPGWGARFPDQSHVYDPAMRKHLRRAADEIGAALSEGIYAFTAGPVYETPAEIRAYASMGADAVGMSTVPEVTLASAVGMRVAGLSCITNMAAGISGPHLSHDEVIKQTRRTAPTMAALVSTFLALIAAEITEQL